MDLGSNSIPPFAPILATAMEGWEGGRDQFGIPVKYSSFDKLGPGNRPDEYNCTKLTKPCRTRKLANFLYTSRTSS